MLDQFGARRVPRLTVSTAGGTDKTKKLSVEFSCNVLYNVEIAFTASITDRNKRVRPYRKLLMNQTIDPTIPENPPPGTAGNPRRSALIRIIETAMLTALAFYFSLISTSAPIEYHQRDVINRAINVLEGKGFDREAFLLGRLTTFRRSDSWLNLFSAREDAYASTNCPFGIITTYPDFYSKAADDTERAMILLHEAQHLQGKNEAEAYAYVWKNRSKLGWTILPYGTTPTFITIELQTRENAPDLFTCPQNRWSDCTEVPLMDRPTIARNERDQNASR